MVESKKTKHSIKNYKKVNIIFRFTDKCFDGIKYTKKEISKVERNFDFLESQFERANLLRNTKVSMINENTLIFHFLSDFNEKVGKKIFQDFDSESKEYIREIIITNQISEDFSDLKTIKGKERRRISLEELDLIPISFQKKVSFEDLEILLTHTILQNEESYLTKEERHQYNHLYPTLFLRLVEKESFFTEFDIKRIFYLIRENGDNIVKEFLFYMLKKKADYYSLGKIITLYEKIKECPPFENLSEDGINSEIEDNLIKLKAYLKSDYLMEKIYEIRERFKDSKNPLYKISFNPEDYNFSKYPNLSNKLNKIVLNQPEMLLKAFKRVLEDELGRTRNKKDLSLIISFEIGEEGKENNDVEYLKYYYRSIESLNRELTEILKKESKKIEINNEKTEIKSSYRKFVILQGFFIESKNIDIKWEREFELIDYYQNKIHCKILENKKYFDNLDISQDSEILIQGYVVVEYSLNNKRQLSSEKGYLEVIDITIIDSFETIRKYTGKYSGGNQYFENTRMGLIKRTYTHKSGKILAEAIIVQVPIRLLDIYKRPDAPTLIYEIKLGDKIIIETIGEICDYIEKTDMVGRTGNILKDAISHIFFAYRETENYQIKPLLNAIGVFLDENKELMIANPFEKKFRIVGENNNQQILIDKILRNELDEKGELTQNYYKIFENPAMKLNARLAVYGFAAINPFFYALRNDIKLKFFLFLIGAKGTGKSTILDLLLDRPFAKGERGGENVFSPARATSYLTVSTIAENFDDIDKLEDILFSLMKSLGTGNQKRERMKKDSKTMMSEDYYSTFAGSGNSMILFNGSEKEAVRVRCLIVKLYEKIKLSKDPELIRDFRKNENIITEGKLYGFYLLEKAIEFADSKIKERGLLIREKLAKIIRMTKRKIEQLEIDRKIRLTDIRRSELYAFIHVGLQIWDYIFDDFGLHSQILKDVLDWKNERYINFIKEFEEEEITLRYGDFENVISFLKSEYLAKGEKIYYWSKSPQVLVLTTHFVNAYDRFAKVRGYETLGTLPNLAERESYLLGREIKNKTYYCSDKERRNGVLLYLDEIEKIQEETLQEGEQIYCLNKEENKKGINQFVAEQIFNSNIKSTKKFKVLMTRIREIFEENEGKDIKKDALIQVLALEDDFEENEIHSFLMICEEDLILKLRNGVYTLLKRIL